MIPFNPETFDYVNFIQDNFQIVNKQEQAVDFKFNQIQARYAIRLMGRRDIILKARQEGFSSLIDAIWCVDFLMRPNSNSIIVADNDENAEGLLTRVKYFLKSYEQKNKFKINLKYDTKIGMVNEFINSTLKIGTAGNSEFGRSRTITNLHLSETAFYPDIRKIIAGAGNAVIESGRIIMETTANGLNDFYDFYELSKAGRSGYETHFFKASEFYTPEFLAQKRAENGRLFAQEYPENDIEAFLTSGDCFFDTMVLKEMLGAIRPAMGGNLINALPV